MVLSDRDCEILRTFARRIDPSDAGAHNNLGALYFMKGMVDEAIEQFRSALELDAKMRIAQQNLELAHKHSGYYDRRVTELRERLRADPDDRASRWELGRAYSVLGQHDVAAEEFRTLMARDKTDVAALIQLALAHRNLGDFEQATELLERACELDQESSIVRFYLGELFYNRGLNVEAQAALNRAIELSPDNADAHYLLAFVLGDRGDHEGARQATKRAIQLNPTYGRAQANLALDRLLGTRRSGAFKLEAADTSDESALAHYNLGLAFRQQGYYHEALREYRLALERGEDRLLVRQAIAEVFLLLRDLTTAVELYDQLLAELPESQKLWNERGVALHQMARFDEAIESYKHALALASDYGLALNNLGISYIQAEDIESAVETLTEAIRREPSLAVARLNLGLLYLQVREFQLSLEAFRKVVEGESETAPAWNGIGLVLNELGRAEDARNAFARAVEADADSAEAHYNLSFALSALGDYDGALRAVTRAQNLDPYYVPQKFRLAIDLQYEDPDLSIVPEISAEIKAEETGPVAFDQSLVDKLFAELDKDEPEKPTGGTPDDPLALARDYLNKGLLDLAAAEADRAASRGAEAVEVQILAGDIYDRRGLHGEALDRYRAARALDDKRVDARLGEVRQLLALGRGKEASADAVALANERPEDVDILVAVAEVRLTDGDPAAALESLKLARGRAPQRADLLKLEGDIAVDMGDLESARKAYEGAIDLDPRYAQARVDLGRVHEARSDWKAAEASYRAALEALPTFSEAAVALARVYRRANLPRFAVNLLVDVLANDPSDTDALAALGHALLDDGRLERALEAYERVLAFDDRHVAANFYAGVVLGRLRLYEPALSRWNAVIKLEPDGPYAREARKHIRSALDLQHIFTGTD